MRINQANAIQAPSPRVIWRVPVVESKHSSRVERVIGSKDHGHKWSDIPDLIPNQMIKMTIVTLGAIMRGSVQ